MERRFAVMAALAALTGCLQTTGTTDGVATAAAPAAPAYKPKVDMASAPNGGGDYEKHVALCNNYVANDAQQKATGSMTTGALQGLASSMSGLWSGGLSSSGVASAFGNAAAMGGSAMLQEQAKQKAQAQQPPSLSPSGAEFVRTCMKSYGYKVTE